MARVRRPPVEAIEGGVRAALIAHYRRWVERVGGDPFARLGSLLRGEPIVLQRWQIPKPWRDGAPGGLNDWVRVEPDGELVAVRAIIFVGRHRVGGAVRAGRHHVDHVPLGPDGDRTEVAVGLDDVRRRVADPECWSL